jgi:HEPN domain-containing protein
MTPLTREWVDKAEGDWGSLGREMRARKAPNHDSACFHAQQCAEKYLKARLQEAAAAFPKTHDLMALLVLVLPLEPQWNVLYAPLFRLKTYAIQYRYPGASASKADVRTARRDCRAVRDAVRLSLGLLL